MKRLVFGQDIHAAPFTGAAPAAGPFQPPRELVLKVDPTIRIEDGYVVATAELQNPTKALLRVIVLGPDPFIVPAPSGSGVIKRYPAGSTSKQQDLVVIEVPAGSTVLFTNRTALDCLFYEGTPVVQFPWQFMLAGAPQYGHFQIMLPRRASHESFFIEGQAVSETVFKNRIETLTGEENKYSERSPDEGGQTAWTSKDSAGHSFKVVHDSFDGWQLHQIYALPRLDRDH